MSNSSIIACLLSADSVRYTQFLVAQMFAELLGYPSQVLQTDLARVVVVEEGECSP